jgi:hypothetical protein
MAFFSRWWNEQEDNTKNGDRRVVQNGQLDVIKAGWCMNDEAAPYYEDVIDKIQVLEG